MAERVVCAAAAAGGAAAAAAPGGRQPEAVDRDGVLGAQVRARASRLDREGSDSSCPGNPAAGPVLVLLALNIEALKHCSSVKGSHYMNAPLD